MSCFYNKVSVHTGTHYFMDAGFLIQRLRSVLLLLSLLSFPVHQLLNSLLPQEIHCWSICSGLEWKYLWEQDCRSLLSGQLVRSLSAWKPLFVLRFPANSQNMQVSSCEEGRGYDHVTFCSGNSVRAELGSKMENLKQNPSPYVLLCIPPAFSWWWWRL